MFNPAPKRNCSMSDLSLPSSAKTPGFELNPSPFGRDPFPLGQCTTPNRPAAPAPHLGRAAPGTTGHSLSDRICSAHGPGPRIYIWLTPPPPACPKKLLESWKRFRRAPWLPEGGGGEPKTSPKRPWLPPLCLRALFQSLGPTAP